MKMVIVATAVYVVLAALSVSRADTILFIDNLELAGDDVQVERETDENVVVRVTGGKVAILKSRIKKIEIDYATRKTALIDEGKDTPRALYELGQVCERYGMKAEALDAYSTIVARLDEEDVPLDILLALGDAFETNKKWPEARACYEKYLETNPGRLDVIERLSKVVKHIKTEDFEPVKIAKAPDKNDEFPPAPDAPDDVPAEKPAEQPRQPGKEPAKEPDKQPAEEPAEKPDEKPKETKPAEEKKPDPDLPQVIEGLEAEAGWKIESWGNKGQATVLTQGDEIKNKILAVNFSSNNKDKVAIKLAKNVDLTKYSALVMDVFNDSERALALCVAFSTQPDWKWYESRTKPVLPGQWRSNVMFDLTSKRYKAKDTNWRYITEIRNKHSVAQTFILVYNSIPSGSIYFDNIGFKTEEEVQKLKKK